MLVLASLANAILIPAAPVFAATSGPRNAGTGTDVIGVGTIVWTNSTNIQSTGSPYAVAPSVPKNGGKTHYLMGTNYGFTIPSGATIDGITVTINRLSSGTGGTPYIRDSEVKLIKNWSLQPTNKAATTTDWPTSMGTATYGGTADLWSNTWTAEDINAASFGVVLSATNPSTNKDRDATVDYIQVTVTYHITPTTLTVTAASGTYGDTVSLTATLSPAVSGKTINFYINGESKGNAPTDGSGIATLTGVAMTVGSTRLNVGTYTGTYNTQGIGANFAGDTGYTSSTGTANLQVTTRPITVTAATDSKTYDGGTTSAGTPTITSGSLVGSDTATWTQTFDNGNVGNSKTLTPAGSVSDGNSGNNYAVTLTPVTTGAITTAPLSITANASTKTYDGLPYSGGNGVTYSGFVNGETSAVLGGILTYGGTSQGAIGAGDYAITPGGLTSSNYAITFHDGTLTVNKATLTVTPDGGKSKFYGETFTDFTGGYTGQQNGDTFTVTYTSAGAAPAAAVASYDITVYSITGTNIGNYNLVNNTATGGLTVNKATPVITWANPDDIYYGTALSSTQLCATSSATGDFVYAPATGTVLSAGLGQTLHVDFTPYDTTNYSAASKDVYINVLQCTIEIDAPADISDWTLYPGTNSLPTNTMNVTVHPSSKSWTVTAQDLDTVNTNGHMTLWDGSVYNTLIKLTNAMRVHGPTLPDVTLPGEGTIVTGSGTTTNIDVTFTQEVAWTDAPNEAPATYQIVVTFTATLDE